MPKNKKKKIVKNISSKNAKKKAQFLKDIEKNECY